MHISSRVHKSSFQGMNSGSGSHRFSQSLGSKWKGSTLVRDSNRKRSDQASRRPRIVDEDGHDVTPLCLTQPEAGEIEAKPGRWFLRESFTATESETLKSTSSFTSLSSSSFIGSSFPSSLSYQESHYVETEESPHEQDVNINLPCSYVVQKKIDHVKEDVTEEMSDEEVSFFLSETDTISLLDIPSAFIPEDTDEAIKERNIQYAELCHNRMYNNMNVERFVQRGGEASKNKQIQSNKIIMVDRGTVATVWDIYDSFCQKETPEADEDQYLEFTVSAGNGRERRSANSSSSDSIISSQSETEMHSLNAEPDPEEILLSESFRSSLLIMERNIVANLFQPKLAAYRDLPVLKDPDEMMKPGFEQQSEEEESCLTPTLEHLWAFSCELTTGCSITSMAWNKKNLDLLAVGYNDCESRRQKPGLICCWSLKNLTWPERVFYCHESVTTLDFSGNKPCQLAVGMHSGAVAIYNVHIQDSSACVATSSECLRKHVAPVWQVIWTKQELRLSAEDREEYLVSVSADGRIVKWFLCNNGLDCIDLMLLTKPQDSKKAAARSKKKKHNVLSTVAPALCADFHQTDTGIYLAGTHEGLIHKCSIYNRDHFLDTYTKHRRSVNLIEWSPFSPNVFLSCSSDWTILLWKQGLVTPVFSFSCTQSAVYSVKWSPNWSTVFAVLHRQQCTPSH
ncbi:dynein axonemal intermediate chain 4-like isoform X2 [Mugil cephalus]|uniref:dynein axonemal intermediate chain 4-like isoform X2 n=1 Tax=Mugil cephalus TaxID=48193 RepID=UPI001FB5DBF1|nr:dynein axonemal intermediate chain 4-like isoform X2 [Mugil cephalus]